MTTDAWPPELARTEFLRLTTTAPDGTPSATPMRFAGQEGALLVVSCEGTDEVAHLRADPRARVVACDASGTPAGEEVAVTARLLEGGEADRVRGLVERRHGVRGAAADLVHKLRSGGSAWVAVELHRLSADEG